MSEMIEALNSGVVAEEEEVAETETSEQTDPKYTVAFTPKRSEVGRFRLVYVTWDEGMTGPSEGQIAEALAKQLSGANPTAFIDSDTSHGQPAWADDKLYRCETVRVLREAPKSKSTRQKKVSLKGALGDPSLLKSIRDAAKVHEQAGATAREAFMRAAGEKGLSEDVSEQIWGVLAALIG